MSFEKWDDRSRRIMRLAYAKAKDSGNDYFGTGHVLLAMTEEEQSRAYRIFDGLGVNVEKVRAELKNLINTSEDRVPAPKPFPTPQVKRMVERANNKAKALNYDYVRTEHLLWGLLSEKDDAGFQILSNLGVKSDDVSAALTQLIDI